MGAIFSSVSQSSEIIEAAPFDKLSIELGVSSEETGKLLQRAGELYPRIKELFEESSHKQA